MIGIQEERPPYVVFETRAQEDRQASIDAGHMVYKNVDYAIITPMGSKDRIERVVSEWLAHIAKESQQQRFDPRWLEGYKSNYKLWKDGQDIPVDGTPLKEWPGLSPAQLKNFNNINVRSVEDVASANEETLARMGHGARDLKKRAAAWLKSAESVGKVAEQFSQLKTENERLADRNTELERKLLEIGQRLAFLETGGGISHQTGDSSTKDVDFN